MKIPKQLQKTDYRFVPIKAGTKMPVGKDWQTTNNSMFDKLPETESYGVVCGFGNLYVLDLDSKELQKQILPLLPKTFTVKTGGKGLLHLYYISKNPPKSFKVTKEGKTLCDVQGIGKQVIGVGSRHAETGRLYELVNDIPIVEFDIEDLKKILPKSEIKEFGASKGGSCKKLIKCKFHNDQKPSLAIYNNNTFYCFGCQAHGDIEVLSHLGELNSKKTTNGTFYWIPKEETKEKLILKFPTKHMPFFKEFDRITQLIGGEYLPIKKFSYRQMISLAIDKDIIQIGDVYTDKRLHGLYCMGSGDGKRNIKYASKLIAQGIGKEVSEPSSIHSEQLIGKVIERSVRKGENPYNIYGDIVLNVAGNRVHLMNKGYLADDLLQLEEAKEFFTSKDKDYIECREKLCIGLDPIGRNEVTKRSVDNLRGETVRYNPKCVTQAFLQKYRLPEEVVLKGALRRFLIPYVHLDIEERNYEQKWNAPSDFQTSIDAFVEYLKQIHRITANGFEFTEEAKQKLSEFHQVLVSYGKNFSEKCYNFTKIIDWTLQEFLVKISINVASSLYTNKITKEVVEIAFMDLIEIWHLNLNFIEEKIMGHLDYGEGYKGSNLSERVLLDWLITQKAISYETTSVSIADFLEEVKKIFKTDSESTARQKYLKMKDKGLIDSKQAGKTLTRVWTGLNPRIHKGCKGFKGFIQYNLIFNELKSKLKEIKPLQPLKPLTENIVEEVVK